MVKMKIIKATIAILLLASLLLPAILLPSMVSAAASTVDSTLTVTGLQHTFQRNTFYSDGRYWVFYSDGTNEVFKSSTDGLSWSSKTTVRVCVHDDYFSLYYDSYTGYVHYAYSLPYGTDMALYYRSGNPNSDGTITDRVSAISWGSGVTTGEQTAIAHNANYINAEMGIATDSTGHPWISYEWWNASTCIGAKVIRSDNTNGTWSTTSGYPYQVNTLSPENTISTSIVPLASGKMAVVWFPSGDEVGIRQYNGSGWETTKYTTNIVYGWEYGSVVSDKDDEVHIAFRSGSTIKHVIYDADTNLLGSEVTVASVASAPSLSIDITNNEVYCFWSIYATAHVWYDKYSGGSWLGDTDWIDESGDGSVGTPYSFFEAQNNKVGVAYMSSYASSPYNLRFNLLDMEPEPTPTPSGSPSPTPTPTPTPTPVPGTSRQPLIGGSGYTLDPYTTVYSSLSGGGSWTTNEPYHRQLVSTPGNITTLSVKLNKAPGSGKSYTFAVMKNGIATSLSVTVFGSSTQETDNTPSHSVSVEAEDYLTLRCTPDSIPASSTIPAWSSVFVSDYEAESLILGSVMARIDAGNTTYSPIAQGYAATSFVEASMYQVIPTSGKIKNLYVLLDDDPGTNPNGYKFTLRLNGGNTTLTCSVVADDTTGSDVAHEITVSAGDYVDLMIEWIGTPTVNTTVAVGMTFEADTPGESVILGGSGYAIPVGTTKYNTLTTTHWYSAWWEPETYERQLQQPYFELKDFYVRMSSTSTGQCAIRVVTNGSNSDIAVFIPVGLQVGSDTTNSLVMGSYSTVSVSVYTTGTSLHLHWGIVAYETAEPPPTPTPTPTVTPTPTGPTPTPTITPTPTPICKIAEQIESIEDCLVIVWYWDGYVWTSYEPDYGGDLCEMTDGESYNVSVSGDSCDLAYTDDDEDYYYYDLDDGWNTIIWEPYTVIGDPDVETRPATYVSYNSAQLNAYIVTDGGSACYMRFQYYADGEVAWSSSTSWEAAYYTGNHYSRTIIALPADTLYHFRAQIKKGLYGAIFSGDSLDFTTATTIGSPSNCLAIPRVNTPAVDVTWIKGTGSLTSFVRYKTGGYPTNYLDGTLAGEVVDNSIEITNLAPGVTYYIRIWAKAGTSYSSGYTSCMVTIGPMPAPTAAGDISTPGNWFFTTDPTVVSMLPWYGVVNSAADAISLPRSTGWFLMAAFDWIVIMAAAWRFSASFTQILVLGFIAASILAGMRQLPGYIPMLSAIPMLAAIVVGARRV